VVDVRAEDDGLGVAVGVAEELDDALRNAAGALGEDEEAVEVGAAVVALRDELLDVVKLAGRGAPALEVDVEVDADDLEGGEVAVGDPLLEGVRVDGLAEVVGVRTLAALVGWR